MDRGNPQSAAAGGSGAGGTIVRFAGGFGVTGQSATFRGRPSHPASAASNKPRTIVPVMTGASCFPLQWRFILRIRPPIPTPNFCTTAPASGQKCGLARMTYVALFCSDLICTRRHTLLIERSADTSTAPPSDCSGRSNHSRAEETLAERRTDEGQRSSVRTSGPPSNFR